MAQAVEHVSPTTTTSCTCLALPNRTGKGSTFTVALPTRRDAWSWRAHHAIEAGDSGRKDLGTGGLFHLAKLTMRWKLPSSPWPYQLL